jgi:hypothetical protein
MSEGGSAGRSCNRFGAAGIRQGCFLWVEPQIGPPAKTSSTRIMVSPPVLCLSSQLEMGWGDQPGLTKMGKQRMPGSSKRGIVTVRRFFCGLYTGGSALRAPWWPYQKINERNTGSLAKVATVLADICKSRMDSAPREAAGSED